MAAEGGAKIKEIFQKYDKDGDGTISVQELQNVLRALGNFTTGEIKAVFAHIDKNGDGILQYEEFVDWLFANNSADARAKAALVPAEGDNLRNVFYSFCGLQQSEIDGKGFMKLCKDAKLLDGKLTTTDIDLIFAKCVTKGQRRIPFENFDRLLLMIADKKKVDVDMIRAKLETLQGPKANNATQLEACRFYDERPGAGKTDEGANRGNASKNGVIHDVPAPLGGRGRGRAGSRPPSPQPDVDIRDAPSPSAGKGHGRAGSRPPSPSPDTKTVTGAPGTLLDAFKAFCKPSVDMDGKAFAKACKDSGLIDSKFSGTDVDLAFAKIARGARKIGMFEFEEALSIAAQKKGVTPEEVKDRVAACGGPILRGTQATDVKFRSDMKKTTLTGPGADAGEASPQARSSGGVADEMLVSTFHGYCKDSDGMDGKVFAKLCKDTGLIDSKFSLTDVDLAFAKIGRGARKLSLEQFEEILALVAKKKGTTPDEIELIVKSCSGPKLKGTHATDVTFRTDKR